MRGGRQKGGLSSFQALTTAIAAQVGTGNIIGACGAILLGGPNAAKKGYPSRVLGKATKQAKRKICITFTLDSSTFRNSKCIISDIPSATITTRQMLAKFDQMKIFLKRVIRLFFVI